MSGNGTSGWKELTSGYPWFAGDGKFRLPAYSEFMPPVRLGLRPYGAKDATFSDEDPYGWNITEIEQEYELKPGLENIARQVLGQLHELGEGVSAHHIAGHMRRNLQDNPYWPSEIAAHVGHLHHERYVILLPLALSRTQDDLGRVRWTLFGSSEQGPERAFWRSFYAAPGSEIPERDAISFMVRLLQAAYGTDAKSGDELLRSGFRVLPSPPNSKYSFWKVDPLPSWTHRFVLREGDVVDRVNYLLTFTPFGALPASVRERYLAGKLHLLPFPGSLLFWGVPVYLRLQEQLPFAMQLPLQRLVMRHDGPGGIRVPQSGWLHEPGRNKREAELQAELLLNTYRRTNRWNRVRRDEDAAAKSVKADRVARVLFSTSLDAIDLYDKPLARNCQLWNEKGELLLDGPNAAHEDIAGAAEKLAEGGIFRYRFQFPAMRVGLHEVYWQRPLVAFIQKDEGKIRLLDEPPLGYMTAYRAEAPDLSHHVELFPRLLSRRAYRSALTNFEAGHDHFAHETPLNIITLLDSRDVLDKGRLAHSFARHLIRTAKGENVDKWLKDLSIHSLKQRELEYIRRTISSLLEVDQQLPLPITFDLTATRDYEESYWNDIKTLSAGAFVNKDNADVVQDPSTLEKTKHHGRDLGQLADYLVGRHRQAIASANMEGEAIVGKMHFRWQTDFDFPLFGGWILNQGRTEEECNILVIIPGKDHREAVVLGDHYDTAYMEDVYDKSRGGSGARLAAPGADDNCSATATLLQATPIFLELAKRGQLKRDVWLLHLTGEEFPADSMGARNFCQSVVQRTLSVRVNEDSLVDLSHFRLVGVFIMDMIAHNRENAQDIFQISPGRSSESLRMAYQAHIANMVWNEKTSEWNRGPERFGSGRGMRSADAITIPQIARHPKLVGEVRTYDDPQSSLYNTDCQVFSDTGIPVVLFMENYDINRTGYHDTKDTMADIDLDYGAGVSAIAIETVARVACLDEV